MPDAAANFSTLLLSTTYTLPALSTATPDATVRPLNGSKVGVVVPTGNVTTRLLEPVTYTLPPVSTATSKTLPVSAAVNGNTVEVSDPAASSNTLRLSVTYELPTPSTARPPGYRRPVNGSTVGVVAPTGNVTTLPLP
ncbi:MAG: hypothetical protein WA622_24485 [Mycobacterium sp.]